MIKFNVYGDPQNPPRFSSSIIINSINDAAKKIDLYDEAGAQVCYDCIGKHHGRDPDALIVCYELPFAKPVVNNIQGKPVIGVSRDNVLFATLGGIPTKSIGYTNLGVDTSVWKPVEKKYMKDKFVVLSYTESLVRSGLEILVAAFGKAFSGKKDCVLYIKDRNATPLFETWIKETAKHLDIELIYDNRHIGSVDEEREIFANADCHVYLNRSSTWAMPPCQTMACGIPTISPAYSGPREYISNYITGLECDHSIVPVLDSHIRQLENVGMRNFFFPIREDFFHEPPFWCQPNLESVVNNLLIAKEDKDLMESIRYNGIVMGNNLTWEKTAANISVLLEEFKND